MQRTSKPTRRHASQRNLLLWLCGVVAIALTMSRHWVICTHEGGHAHLEIKHPESDHQAGHHHDHDHGDCDCDGDHEHGPGSHTELLVEVGPEQQPDSINLPLLPAFEVVLGTPDSLRWRLAPQQFRSPPATGPPRPRRFLAVRATTLLLI